MRRFPAPRVWWGTCLLLVLASTTANATGRTITGAVLAVLAALASAGGVWSWIRRNR